MKPKKKAGKHKKPQRKYRFDSIDDVDIDVSDPDEQNMVTVTVTADDVDSPFGSGVTVSNPTDKPQAILEGRSTSSAPWNVIFDWDDMDLLPGSTNDWRRVFSPTDDLPYFRGTVRRTWDASITDEKDAQYP